ncbi:MAG: hypothetical protein JO086_00115 [Acidimicrobiia bacterium]|nr:hypothetical protein [Acidimicrobiia bacterium]
MYVLLERQLEHIDRQVEAGARSPATRNMQRDHVARLRRLLPPNLPAAHVDHVRLQLLADRLTAGTRGRPIKPWSVAKILSTLHQAFWRAHRRGELARMPIFPLMSGTRPRPAERILRTYEELRRLLEQLRPFRVLYVVLKIWTAMRDADIVRAVWGDFDLVRLRMVIRSTKTRRPPVEMTMPRPLVEALRAELRRLRRKPSPLDPVVRPWPGRSLDLARACIRAGLPPLRSTDLRHTSLSWLTREIGITPATARFGGHSQAVQERFYVHARRPELDRLAPELASIVKERRRTPTPANDNGRAPTRRRGVA